MSNAYHFMSHWRVLGTVDEVAAVLDDATALPRWWPAVYLDVQPLASGDANRIGERFALHTKGFLPYTLRWTLEVAEAQPSERTVIRSTGDFVGYGIWTFRQDGPWADVTYEWNIEVTKPLLRRLSGLLKPVFAANHRWAMATGLRGLELELARRRASTTEERARIPAPPAPTPTSPLPYLLATALLVWLLTRAARRLFDNGR